VNLFFAESQQALVQHRASGARPFGIFPVLFLTPRLKKTLELTWYSVPEYEGLDQSHTRSASLANGGDELSMKRTLAAIGLAVLISAMSPAYGAIVTLSGVNQISAPASATSGSLVDNINGQIFAEQQFLLLPSGVAVDLLGNPGQYGQNYTLPVAGTIDPGTRVNSYYLVFEQSSVVSVPTALAAKTYTGSVTFTDAILGVAFYNYTLSISNSSLGNAGTTYNGSATTGNWGINPGEVTDWIAISPDRKTMSYSLTVGQNVNGAPNNTDDLRIITADAPVPEPSAGLLLVPGLALVGLLRRRVAP
jgi:hypothetical protein